MSLLTVHHLRKLFPVSRRGSLGSAFWHGAVSHLHAVDDVGFSLEEGEVIGLVGESGSGKSTLAGLIARTIDPTSGHINFAGHTISETRVAQSAKAAWRAGIQMVFQDSYESLDPRRSIWHAVARPLVRLEGLQGAALNERVDWALDQVHLGKDLIHRLPHQLSGGQLARTGIARAIALRPKLLILDEPTSALDASVQAVILQLLDRLKTEFGLSMIFVSHDLNVVRLLCQRVLVMYAGRIIEEGPAASVFAAPLHPYTAALVAAVPAIQPGTKPRAPPVTGEPLSPIDPPPGICRFEGRCFKREVLCRQQAPELVPRRSEQAAACHYPLTAAAEAVIQNGCG